MRILGLLIVFERADAISLASAYARAPGAKEPTDPIGCPRSGTNRHWGPFRGPASALGYGGDLIITWFRYLPGKIGLPGRLGGLFTGGTGEFVVHGDAAPAVAAPRRPARCPGLHTYAGQEALGAAGRVRACCPKFTDL